MTAGAMSGLGSTGRGSRATRACWALAPPAYWPGGPPGNIAFGYMLRQPYRLDIPFRDGESCWLALRRESVSAGST